MKNILYKIKNGFIRFMSGRYGGDLLNLVLVGISLTLDILFMIFRLRIFSLISLVPLVLAFLRMFSRNTAKRYEENRKFINFFKNLKTLPTHHIYRCPSCRQKIRVPRKGGKTVEITCPKCHERFRKKI